MRFLLFDRVTLLDRDGSIAGLKAFTLSDEHLRGHFGRSPLVPLTMLVESMAQLLGWAVVSAHDFQLMPILCLLEGVAARTARLRPGFLAHVGAKLLSTSTEDSLGRAWVEVDGERVAEVERVIFRHFRPVDPDRLRRLFGYCSGLGEPQLRGGFRPGL